MCCVVIGGKYSFEKAIHIITTHIIAYREGREIQKLSIIRTLVDLLETDGNECIDKVLPLIQVVVVVVVIMITCFLFNSMKQKVLHDETGNLDLHCEGAISYRNILSNRKLIAQFDKLGDCILRFIIDNVERQKDNRKLIIIYLISLL